MFEVAFQLPIGLDAGGYLAFRSPQPLSGKQSLAGSDPGSEARKAEAAGVPREAQLKLWSRFGPQIQVR